MLTQTSTMIEQAEFCKTVSICPPEPFCTHYYELKVTLYNTGKNLEDGAWLVRVDELSWDDHEGLELEILSESCLFSSEVSTLIEARNLYEYKCLSCFSKVMTHKVEEGEEKHG